MEPLIFAKAALDKNQIEVKKNIGCDGIEIQLLDEIRKTNGWCTLEEAFNLDELEFEPVSVVHAPIVTGIGDMTIEQMADGDIEEDRDDIVFFETCRLAEIYGKNQNKVVTVVIHSETFLGFISGMGGTLSNIEKIIGNALETHPHIQIGIENVSPLRGIGKGRSLHLANNFKFDNVELVQRIRKDLNTDRVGTVLDTCHAMLADKYISCLYREAGDREPEDLSLDAYFRENKDTCFLVHLCGMRGSGYGKGRHGTPFHAHVQEELDTCNNILKLYEKYGYTCPITLEVEEDDFSICDGYRSTKEVVDMYFKQ